MTCNNGASKINTNPPLDKKTPMDHSKSVKNARLDWLDEIDIDDLITGDLQIVDEWCGRDVLLSLLKNCPSVTLYISQRPVNEAKKRYIRKHYDRKSVKLLCALLDVPERFVYQALDDEKKREK